MDDKVDSERQVVVEGEFRNLLHIDPNRARFPCCIVWTPLPVISWLIPFIGHIGICREDGVILDFAGPNFVCVDNFAFGSVARYVQINMKKDCCISSDSVALKVEDQHERDLSGTDTLTWDGALRKSTQEFQHRSYNLFTCNCHSFVANNLNRLGFHSGRWNVVNLAAFILVKGRWVNKAAALRSLLPFIIVSTLGILIGGKSFINFLAFFAFLLVGWFLLGTYCFKSLIQL